MIDRLGDGSTCEEDNNGASSTLSISAWTFCETQAKFKQLLQQFTWLLQWHKVCAGKMRHTDLITDKDAGYVKSTGDRHSCANALALMSHDLKAKYKCEIVKFDIQRKCFSTILVVIKILWVLISHYKIFWNFYNNVLHMIVV